MEHSFIVIFYNSCLKDKNYPLLLPANAVYISFKSIRNIQTCNGGNFYNFMMLVRLRSQKYCHRL